MPGTSGDYIRGWNDACTAIAASVKGMVRPADTARDSARVRMLDPGTVAKFMADHAGDREERFWTLTLDARGRLLGRHQIAQGSVTACPVHARDALSPAVREQAHGVIFVHNHPSGDPAPSSEDHDLTHRLQAAAELLGLVARDHVIVGSDGYFSFVEAGRWRR